ncbi:MAG: hypothetical protein MI975_15220 [Cytophagales bacterium]|nr:hypothetical protein [Cytophagales bacterium]
MIINKAAGKTNSRREMLTLLAKSWRSAAQKTSLRIPVKKQPLQVSGYGWATRTNQMICGI